MNSLYTFTIEDLSKMQIIDWGYSEELESRSYNKFHDWVEQGLNRPLGYLEGERGEKRESLSCLPR